MYESHFELQSRPFLPTVCVERFFSAAAVQSAMETISRCVERAEGPALLIGPVGTGKTTICYRLARRFQEDYEVALLASGRLCTRRGLLQAILFELGLPYRDMDEGELRLALLDHLDPARGRVPGLVLIVDEAHTLPLRLLEELRLLTNIVHHNTAGVRMVLAGGPHLEERFASPKIESFSQRIAARCYLEPYSQAETRDYVCSQLIAAGTGGSDIFTSDALGAVYRATGGVPRLINQVCDHALLLGAAGGRRTIDAAGIEEAWSDLQQLPMPIAPPPSGAADEVIEFGGLDEEDQAASVPFPARGAARGTTATADEEFDADIAGAGARRSTVETESDDEFEPAGTIGPEVEVSMSAAASLEIIDDPFNESFEHVEAVIDPSASLEADVLARSPVVRSPQGKVLGGMLAQLVTDPIPSIAPDHDDDHDDEFTVGAEIRDARSEFDDLKRDDLERDDLRRDDLIRDDLIRDDLRRDDLEPDDLEIVALPDPEVSGAPSSVEGGRDEILADAEYDTPRGDGRVPSPAEPYAGWQTAAEQSDDFHMPIDPVDDPVMPEEPLAAPLPQTGAAENAAEELMRQQSGLFSSMETDPVEPDDDLIVVDDDPEPYLGPPAQNAPPRVRRQEYRRLFANLQRG